MKTMMDEEFVHHDIVNKLWQVYSKLFPVVVQTVVESFFGKVPLNHFLHVNDEALLSSSACLRWPNVVSCQKTLTSYSEWDWAPWER